MLLIVALVLGTTVSPAEYVASLESAPILTLSEAREIAVKENFDIRIARERLSRSSLLARKAYAFVLPTVNANANLRLNNQAIPFNFIAPLAELTQPLYDAAGIPFPFTQEEIDGAAVNIQDRWQQSASVSFNWTLLNGRSLPLILNAYDAMDQASFQYDQQKETLTYATSLAYYNALTAARTVTIRERAVEIAERNAELARAQAELGDGTPVDQLRAEVAVATAEQDLVQAQIQKQIADRSLAILLNRIDREGKVVPFRLERPPEPMVELEALLDRALTERLDLKISELDLAITDRLVEETNYKFLPELVMSGALNWSNVEGFAGNNTTWFVQLGLQWEIFSGATTWWELYERRYDLASAAIAIEQRKVQIADDVEQSRLNLANAQSNYEAANRRAELARRSAELAQAQFEVGSATQLEVLDANRSLADAETQEALGQLQVDLARLELERVTKIDPDAALGGGMTTAPPSATDALQSSIAGGTSGGSAARPGGAGAGGVSGPPP